MYGTNSDQIRAELAFLLRQQRTATQDRHSNVSLSAAASLDIRMYRNSVLTWCRGAVDSVSPPLIPTGRVGRGPIEELHDRLDHAIAKSIPGAAGLSELTSNRRSPTVKAWQGAARAAALGEHDFAAGVDRISLDVRQRMTVLKDASEIIHAVVILDGLYALAPEWEQLPDSSRLGRAAVVCAAYAGYDGEDHAVDTFGWRRRPTPITGEAQPGVDGVLQSQHNVAVDLADHFPNSLNLRRVINFQRELSELLAARFDGDQKWSDRAATLKVLERETRDLGGQIGSGSVSAGESASAAGRLSRLPNDQFFTRGQQQRLGRLAEQIDSLLASAIVHGASERLYFIRTALPRLDGRADHLVHGVRHTYVPVERAKLSQLLETAKTQLRPPVREPVRRANPRTEHLMFQAELEQGPNRGPALGM